MVRRIRVALPVFIIALALTVTIVAFLNPTTPPAATNSPAARMGPVSGPLKLSRIPWEGGPTYWDRFPVAKAAGWGQPSFFPIVIWFDSVDTNKEVQADKSYGINSYIGENKATDYELFARNHAFILQALNHAPPGGTAQPGLFIADEPDGRTTSGNDLANIHKIVKATPPDGRFKEINFSMTVISGSNPGINKADFEAMVSSYAGPVSVDKYYYTQPSCDDIRYIIVPIDSRHCRTASSYGATVRAVRDRLAATGTAKPVWNFVEDLSGAPDPRHFHPYIEPGQLEGAVMDSIINEARGILYFNQSFAGNCRGGNILRQVQVGESPCAQLQMSAMRQVDQRIEALASVINTQSYSYSFGSDLDTMLKSYDGSAYIFAMINGAASSWPGTRTFKLPPALAHATSVQVLNEGRTIPVKDGRFSDDFVDEYTYHIYKIAIPSS